MADQLCTPSDLAALLQQDLDASTATLIVEAFTAVVQEAAGLQRILQVGDDVADLVGTTDSYLDLPQIPVTAVSAVTLDGSSVATGTLSGGGNWKRFGNRLWRGDGWQTLCGIPSQVVVTYTHGYPALHQRLQLARGAVLGLARGVYANPSGRTRVTIDDYTEAYEAASSAMNASPQLRTALRRQYGRRAAMTRIG